MGLRACTCFRPETKTIHSLGCPQHSYWTCPSCQGNQTGATLAPSPEKE